MDLQITSKVALRIGYSRQIKRSVMVQFSVDADGKVKNAKVLKGVEKDLDKKALEIVYGIPVWQPGKQQGKAVDVDYNLNIEF